MIKKIVFMLMTIALMVIWSPPSFSTDNDVGWAQTELAIMNEEAPVTMPALNPAVLCWEIEGLFEFVYIAMPVQEVTMTDKTLINNTGLSNVNPPTHLYNMIYRDAASYLNCSIKFD